MRSQAELWRFGLTFFYVKLKATETICKAVQNPDYHLELSRLSLTKVFCTIPEFLSFERPLQMQRKYIQQLRNCKCQVFQNEGGCALSGSIDSQSPSSPHAGAGTMRRSSFPLRTAK